MPIAKILFAFFAWTFCLNAIQVAEAAPPPPASTSQTSSPNDSDQRRLNDEAGAATYKPHSALPASNAFDRTIDEVLRRFHVDDSQNTTARFAIAGGIILLVIFVRRVVLAIIFGIAKRMSARTKTTLDDKLIPALEAPMSLLLVIAGVVTALKALSLSPDTESIVDKGSTMAFSVALFWLLLRVLTSLLAHTEEIAVGRKLGVAAFMPWIKRSIITIFVIFGALLVAQSQGFDVKAFLAGLGIGGLAFALAAQDTLANVFGSLVVAIDQPFKIGEFVQIGANSGSVEDIGLRSTKLRRADKSLVVIPNKTVASEPVINLSRFTQRRFEQNLSITYDARPDQLDQIVEQIRALILAESEIDPSSVQVNFSDFTANAVNIWLVYLTRGSDFNVFLGVRQRLNLAFMREIEKQGLTFAFPVQGVHLRDALASVVSKKSEERPNQ